MAARDIANQHQVPTVSKFGITLYRKDIEDVMTLAKEHPTIAAVGLFVVVVCTGVCMLWYAGSLKQNSPILIVFCLMGAAFLLLLMYSVEMNTLLQAIIGIIFLVWVFIFFTRESSIEKTEVEIEKKIEYPPSVIMAPSNIHSEYETIAQSVCTSMAIKENRAGWTFAVKRQCDTVTPPCQTLCGLQALHNLDAQTSAKQWLCLGAIHVYPNRPVGNPSTLTSPSMGFKVYWSPGYHGGQHCGPNYCCCLAAA